jgi:hypothetical protein
MRANKTRMLLARFGILSREMQVIVCACEIFAYAAFVQFTPPASVSRKASPQALARVRTRRI